MAFLQKKLLIVVLLACGIITYSFFGFWQKETKKPLVGVPAPEIVQTAGTGSNTAANSDVFVYVSGAVNKPGVYRAAQGSRVVDAINMAGGFAAGADAAKINLALHLKDEMHINVPFTISSSGTASPNHNDVLSGAVNNNGDKISINAASAAELDKLPGIGPALAERIIQYRTTNGAFTELSDIKKVSGINEAKYNQLKDKISL